MVEEINLIRSGIILLLLELRMANRKRVLKLFKFKFLGQFFDWVLDFWVMSIFLELKFKMIL
jgi:hypothetical protein